MKRLGISRLDLIAVLLIAAWAIWAAMGIPASVVNPFETGVYLNGAKRLLAGQRIYIDFFSIYGAATYYPFALAALVFSRPQVIAGVVFFSYTLVNIALAYGVARRLAAHGMFRFLPLLACFGSFAGGYRLTFALLSMLALFRFFKTRRPLWLALAGAWAAVNLAVQQDMAAYSLAAVLLSSAVVTWSASPVRSVGSALRAAFATTFVAGGGFALVACAWLLWMQHAASADAYVHGTFVVPLRYYDTLHMGSIPLPWSTPPLPPDVVSLWARFGIDGFVRWFIYTIPFYWVPGICIFTVIWGLWKLLRRGGGRPENADWIACMLTVAAFGAFMARTILKTGDELKLIANALPAVLVAAGWASHWWFVSARRKETEKPRRTFAPAATAVLIGLCVLVYTTYPQIQGTLKPLIRGGGRPVAAVPEEVRAAGNKDIVEVARFLATEPASDLFCVPNVPILYLVTGRSNATSFDYLDPIIDREVSPRLLAQLRDRRPGNIVVNEGMRFWTQYEFGHEFGRDIADYIAGQYVDVFHAGSYHVLRRIDSPLSAVGKLPVSGQDPSGPALAK